MYVLEKKPYKEKNRVVDKSVEKVTDLGQR
jgi:hypothetical protein